MLVGNYLSSTETNELIESFKVSTKYKNLIQKMSRLVSIDDSKLEVTQGLKFDIAFNKDIISAKSLTIKLPNDVSIMYIVRHLNGDKDTESDFFVGKLEEKVEDDVLKYTNFTADNDTSVTIHEKLWKEKELVEIESLNKKSKEEFPFDENYYPGQLLNQVDSKAWFSGCMAGGYRWCGEGCGGSIACTSSLQGINGLDNCCKSHDCCYSKRGVKHPNCYCDEILCKCAKSAPNQWNTPLVLVSMCFSC